VKTDDDRSVTYDPRRLEGVTLYRECICSFFIDCCTTQNLAGSTEAEESARRKARSWNKSTDLT